MDVDTFIARWGGQEGGAERANYALFLTELCDVLAVPHADPATATTLTNDYVFERAVQPRESEGTSAPKRIDLYKRGCFILEAKQSRLPGRKKALPSLDQTELFEDAADWQASPRRTRAWDALMANARRQAEEYVFRLPSDHEAPPFLIVCDVGHVLEVYADFSGSGRGYAQFPDRQSFRITLDDLRHEAVRTRLQAIWLDPLSLDPTRKAAMVTRTVAERLAKVSKALEAQHHTPEAAALFLMRCIFTMFAEDVELLPKDSFTSLLQDCLDAPETFAPLVTELWARMDEPDPAKRFYSGLRVYLRHFNGRLFHDATALPLAKDQIRELLAAAKTRWTEVEPAIFGTLLEQALDPVERARLGAHYTPRAYVERLVGATIMEPLTADWQRTLTQVEQAKEDGDAAGATKLVQTFHSKLCGVRVLDPSCGTGNFLYVAMELMKRLEGEVLDTLTSLGGAEPEAESIDPHQFLGIELNPRAAAIAELVLWIGYLQQHYRTYPGHPAEPILRAFGNIQRKDAVLAWETSGDLLDEVTSTPLNVFANAQRPDWPDAEFIVGNPPFIGNKRMRDRLGWSYVDALRSTYSTVGESVDFVMYWWDRAASLLSQGGALRRFGYVTTNSVTQSFNRRVLEAHVGEGRPLSLIFAIPDHPWTKSSKDAAAVRIAMTVAEAGSVDGLLKEVASEEALDTDEPRITFHDDRRGRINPDLTIGVDVRRAGSLLANRDIAHQGVTPFGEGFRLLRPELENLGYSADQLPPVLRRYLIGRDLVQKPEERFIIDFYGLEAAEAREGYPALFQIVLERVKPQRDTVNRARTRDRYWIYDEPRARMRAALSGLARYIVTCRTAKHRIFSFVTPEYLPDTKVVAIALDDAWHLGVLSSKTHLAWALQTGGLLEDRPTYQHGECFNRFPFPDVDEEQKAPLRQAAEELERTRAVVQRDHPDLTLTAIYNVLAKLRAGLALTRAEADLKVRGRVLIIRDLHDTIDRLVAEAYGWPSGLSNEQMVSRLVDLNSVRALEERAGFVRWLRPEHQLPLFAQGPALDRGEVRPDIVAEQQMLPLFPSRRIEQPLAVLDELAKAAAPLDAVALARRFQGGRRVEGRVREVLVTLAKYGRVQNEAGGRFSVRRAA